MLAFDGQFVRLPVSLPAFCFSLLYFGDVG